MKMKPEEIKEYDFIDALTTDGGEVSFVKGALTPVNEDAVVEILKGDKPMEMKHTKQPKPNMTKQDWLEFRRKGIIDDAGLKKACDDGLIEKGILEEILTLLQEDAAEDKMEMEMEKTAKKADGEAGLVDKVLKAIGVTREPVQQEVKIEVVDSDKIAASVAKGIDSKLAEMNAKIETVQKENEELRIMSKATPSGDQIPQGQVIDLAKKAHEDAFMVYVKSGDKALMREIEKATMNVTTASQGGYLVPEVWASRIINPVVRFSYLRQAGATVFPSQYVKGFHLPTNTFSGAAVLTNESAAFDQAEPTVGEIVFNPYKATRVSKVTEELLSGSVIPIESMIGLDASQAFAKFENSYFTTGTGSAQPQGITVGSSLGKTAASPTAIVGDEIVDLFYSLDVAYRAQAKWMMNSATMAYLKKIKVGTGRNDYLWDADLSGRFSNTLLGAPVIINESMPDIATGTKPVVCGDFSYFWIIDFGGLYSQRLEELYSINGQIGFRWFKYVDSNVVLPEAIKHLIMA